MGSKNCRPAPELTQQRSPDTVSAGLYSRIYMAGHDLIKSTALLEYPREVLELIEGEFNKGPDLH